MATITARRQRTTHPISHYWGLVKDLDDSQKLELVSILIDSIKPAVAKAVETDDEEYSLRPFTMKELNARIDQAEAEIAAGKVVDDEDVWRELEEEFVSEDAEEEARQLAAYHEEELLATV
ncbi:MAG: hypothetical protein J5545_06245 [Bacteroidaceae bacterium]|nr:hypothetical protein [Bacteroidaceae bacterium]